MADQPGKILFVSPEEPSGASWLLNCWLELGIRIGHKPAVDRLWRAADPRPAADHIWRCEGGACVLKPKADVLRKWLPALGRQAEFRFRQDLWVEYVQDYPPRPGSVEAGDDPVIFFIRDPRDALYSMYRRTAPAMSFAEFLRFPHPRTLLDPIDNWSLLVRCWQARPGVTFFRFEDYKRDAFGLLQRILATLGLRYDDAEVQAAVEGSSFQAARDSEQRYRERFPSDRQVANRAGKVGDWRQDPENREAVEVIERRTGPLLDAFGYTADTPVDGGSCANDGFEGAANLRYLSFFDTVSLPDGADQAPPALRAQSLCKLLAFAERLDQPMLAGSRLPPDQLRRLLDSLAEFMRRHQQAADKHLQSLQSACEPDPGDHLQRIRDMVAARKRR